MQSVRHRMSSLLRRSSLIGDKSDQSGSERESNSRPGSPSPSLRKVSGDGSSKRRKRVSFSMRGRSGTSDTVDQSQLAKQVVNAIEADKLQESTEEPVVAVVALPTESGSEQAKSDSLVETPDVSKATSLQETSKPVPVAEEHPVEAVVAPVEAQEIIPEAPVAAPEEVEHQAPSVEQAIAKPVEFPVASAEAVPFNVVMGESPSDSMVHINVAEPAPAMPEPAPYDTSFTSTSSAPGTSSVPLSMPVPRPTGQPLSAIDELRAKGHPLADWTQKDDVNYDADEEETKPLLESSFLTGADTSLQRPFAESTLSLRTAALDVKGKGRDSTPIYEALGWTEYILPNASHYFALHMSSPASPQHLKMPTPITASPMVTVVADYDLRDQAILKRVCEEMRTLIKTELPASSGPWSDDGGWELWLHRPAGYVPQGLDATRPPIVHTWVNHARRMLAPRPYGAIDLPPKMDGDAITLVDGASEQNDRDKLSKELAYWSFIEKHPSHGVLQPDARREAIEGLTWSYADRILQDNRPVPVPFSQEECQSLLRLLDGYNSSSFAPDRAISNRMVASILSRIVRHKIAAIDTAEALKSEESSKAVDKKGRPSQVTFPFRRAILGFLSAIICWGIPYLFLDHASAGSDPYSRFKPLQGHVVDNNGMQMYYALENADVTAERRNNAMIYGAGVGVTAAVMIGAATTVLTMRPPLDTPARTAGFVALVCAGASLAASLISLARMSRLSQNTPWATYSPSSDLFFPGVRRDTESLVVLNTKPLRRSIPLVLLAYSIVSLLVTVLLHNFAPKGL